MIDRYTNKALEGLFSDESRFQAYWEIELAVLEAYVSLGIVPAKDYELIKSKAKVDVKRIKEIEEITRHDVVAFTRQVGEGLGEEKRWIHYGLTSTDVVDTAMSLLYKKANAVIIEHIDSLLKAVKAKAIEYKNTPCIGRTHGMHGEIISF
ncbi:MAG: lyase family protein, partial [Candidatus Enteromonas sp.]|nr:lyase family protein [Candidatus Enteromonas sp.]